MLELGMLTLILISIALLFPLIAGIDLIRRNYSIEKKIFWLIVILIIPYLGSVLYWLAGRK